MASLIIIYFTLIAIQRAVSFLFADFPYLSILAQQVFAVFMPVCIYYEFIKKERYIKKDDLKINFSHIPTVFLSGFCMQFFGSFINYPIIVMLDKLNVKAPKMEAVPEGTKIILYIFLICILPAVFEEVLFRKFTFSILKDCGKVKALIVTAVVFGIVHFNLYSLLPLTLAGLMLSFIIYKGFSLIYAILFHFSLNFSGVILDLLTRNDKVNEIINNHFLLFGLIAGFFIFAFTLYISKEAHKNG